MFSFIIFTIHVVLAVIATFILLQQRSLRITNVGWLVTIWFIKIIRPTIFFIFRIRLNSIVTNENNMPNCTMHRKNTSSIIIKHNIKDIGENIGFMHHEAASNIEIYKNDDFFDDLVKEIDKAQQIICIAQYIFSGSVADNIINVLTNAHKRGVKVFLLLDRTGSKLYWPLQSNIKKLQALPFNVEFFLNHGIVSRVKFANNILHSKVAYIDGDKSWLGSHNLRDEIFIKKPLKASPCI